MQKNHLITAYRDGLRSGQLPWGETPLSPSLCQAPSSSDLAPIYRLLFELGCPDLEPGLSRGRRAGQFVHMSSMSFPLWQCTWRLLLPLRPSRVLLLLSSASRTFLFLPKFQRTAVKLLSWATLPCGSRTGPRVAQELHPRSRGSSDGVTHHILHRDGVGENPIHGHLLQLDQVSSGHGLS